MVFIFDIMYHLKELIHFYNNYCSCQIDVKRKLTNKYKNDMVKQKEFINLIVLIPKHIQNIGIIRKNIRDVTYCQSHNNK